MTPVSDAGLAKHKKTQAERSAKYEKYLKKDSASSSEQYNTLEGEKIPLKRYL